MRTLMIHEFHEEFKNVLLSDDLLTFDDGLYTQYLAKDLPQEKIFFISTNIICEGKQSHDVVPCHIAHARAFAGDKSSYMTLSQISDLMDNNTIIGGHSHNHTNLNTLSSLVDKVNHIKEDTELMLEWFEKNLNYQPTHFCFPYNNDMGGLYKGLLKKYGFLHFYGDERIPIETLLHTEHHTGIPYI
jgi:hypothetical protein